MKFAGMGDNVVDRYVNKKVMFPGGNAVNFAVYARKCGMDAAYLGVFADDPEGKLIRNALLELGVDVSGCTVMEGTATERCDVILVDGDRTFVGSGWEDGKERKTLKLGQKELEYLKQFDVIHCGCYAYMEDEMRKLGEFDCIRTFDFSSEEEYRSEAYLKMVCPYVDIALFSGAEMSDDQIRVLEKKVRSYGVSCVLVTNGTKGQLLFEGDREHRGQVKRIEPVDTMGAGDSFFTAFVVSLVGQGWERHGKMEEGMIQEAFASAADFSSKNCLVEGSFGFATPYE